MIASSSTVNTLERGCFGPIGWSLTSALCFHLATVFGLTPDCLANALTLA